METATLLSLESASAAADVELVERRLREYNARCAAPDGYVCLNVFARTTAGGLVGGLLGETYWRWLHVRALWVQESHRGAGLGSRLLAAAEYEASHRGCLYAHLDTFDFQAEPFYLRHGYRVFGVLEELPPGHRRMFMRKELQRAASSA